MPIALLQQTKYNSRVTVKIIGQLLSQKPIGRIYSGARAFQSKILPYKRRSSCGMGDICQQHADNPEPGF